MALRWILLPACLTWGFAWGLSRERPQVPQATIRSEVALVNLYVTVQDRNNRFVPNLTAADFQIFEDKVPQKIEYFSDLSQDTKIPRTIALLIDSSGSVKQMLPYEKATAAEFFRKVLRKGKDLALIIQFDSEVNLVHDFTDDVDVLIDSMDSIRAGNATALYDAVFLAVDEKLKQEVGRRIIVVITDGDDTISKVRKETAIELSQKHDVLIFGIGIRGNFGADFGVLKRFAQDTGGSFFSPRARMDEIESAFRAINDELQGQYSIAYTSTNTRKDGGFRQVDIRCKQSGVRIKTRKGYYAPKS